MKKEQKKFYSKEIKRTKQMNEDYQKALAFIVVLAVIAGLVFLLFIFNGKFVSKDYFQETTTTTTTEVSYDSSLLTVSTLFSVSDEEYYVMFYDTEDDLTNFLYEGLVVSYNGDISLYSVDLNNVMNRKYYDKNGEANKAPTKSSGVLVTGPTLMHIKKKKVVDYITDRDAIIKVLARKPVEEE